MSAPLYGQVAVSGTAQVLVATARDVTGFTIKAPASNVLPIFLGDKNVLTTTGHQLDPGDSLDYERLNQNGQPVYQLKPSDFWVVGTAPDIVTWLASP